MNALDWDGKIDLLRSLMGSRELPISVAADLLGVNRTSVYYRGTPASELELAAKVLIDALHTEHPAWGARQLSKQLQIRGIHIGRKKVRRYMTEMAIDANYPKENLSKRAHGAKIYPYLLRNAVIDRPNQAWSIDITYIRLEHGLMATTCR